jgi:circadian clock protein KaiB
MPIDTPSSCYYVNLYITGQTPKSDVAIANIQKIFSGLNIPLDLTVIDILEQPQLAEENRILATPTLIKISPLPVRRIIGDLSDRTKVRLGLGLPASTRLE